MHVSEPRFRLQLGAHQVLFAAVLTVLVCLIIPPLAVLVQTSFWVATSATSGSFSIDNYVSIFQSRELVPLIANSLIFGIGSSILGVAIGSLLAWLVERTNTPLKSLAYVSAFIALAIPEIIKTVGWVFLLGPRNGLLNVWLRQVLNTTADLFDVFSMAGMILVSALMWAPAVFLLLAVPFRSMDASLEEASAMSGANAWSTFWRVTFPLARPAVLSLLLLTFVRLLESFEVPAILGIPGKVYVLTTGIYLKMSAGMFPDYGVASAYSVLLMVLVSGGIYMYTRATQNAQKFSTITGKGFRPRLLDLGRIRILTAGLVLLLPVALALPFGILLWASFQPFYSVPTVQALSHMTLDNYSSAFANANIRSSVMNSMLIGVLASSLVIGLSTVVSWIILRTRIRGRHLLDLLVALVLVFPGVVLGLAILRTYLVVPVPIYGTLWILVIAYVARFVPYAQRFIHPGLIQIQKELEESAQMSGAGWMAIFRRILIPLLMPALFGAWIWVFLTSVRELSMSVLLVSPQSQVVATTLFALWQEGQLSEMAAYSVALTTALATLALILRRISGRWGIQA
jgi:iron(III) transport system permease protein